MAEPTHRRIAFIDWMRGFACLLMFQAHGYDAWLNEASRHTQFWTLSRLGATMPAPIFLLIAGISIALVRERLLPKGISAARAAQITMRHGAEIFGWSLLFRLQEYLLGLPWAPWTDLFRVDILNVIGLSVVLLGAACWIAALGLDAADPRFNAKLRARTVWVSLPAAAIVALAAPPLWTTHRPYGWPWFLETYINGVHIFNQPQPYLFPLFPWAAFAFIGLAAGALLLSPRARQNEFSALGWAAGAGIALVALGLWLDSRPQLYAVYDFWHSSPNFLLIREGIVFMLIFLSYVWCRWGPLRWRFDPLIEMGKTSLLVYWVHIEFVYGRFSILRKGTQTIPAATLGVFMIFVAMTVLATVRNRAKGRGLGALAFWRSRAEGAPS